MSNFIVVTYASVGILSAQDEKSIHSRTSTFTWILLLSGLASMVIKLMGLLYYQRRKPLSI